MALTTNEIAEVAQHMIKMSRAAHENPAARDVFEDTIRNLAQSACLHGGRPTLRSGLA